MALKLKLKTRTNQPVETGELEEELEKELGKKVNKIEVTNIEQMSDEQLDALKVGDVVQKITGEQKHNYIVTYKEEKHGICLSYFACGYLETVSYDYVGGHWVFNSKDVCETQEKLVSGTNIKTINGTSVLGSGNIAIQGGTQLYKHEFRLDLFDPREEVFSDTVYVICHVISKKSTAFVRSDFDSELIDWNFISIKGNEWTVIGEEEGDVDITGSVLNIEQGDQGAFSPCVIALVIAGYNGMRSEYYGINGTLTDAVAPL